MKLPKAENAIIPPEKLRDYVLSFEHPIGRLKAAFFSSLGYNKEEWKTLERDLRTQHLALDVEEIIQSKYGTKYIIRGQLKGPSGISAEIISIWVVRIDEEIPRFVTAYSGRRK